MKKTVKLIVKIVMLFCLAAAVVGGIYLFLEKIRPVSKGKYITIFQDDETAV